MSSDAFIKAQKTSKARTGERDATAETARESQRLTARMRAKREKNEHHTVTKKCKLAQHSPAESRRRGEAPDCNDDILLFTNPAEGIKSDWAKGYFYLLQKTVLQKLHKHMRRVPGTDIT